MFSLSFYFNCVCTVHPTKSTHFINIELCSSRIKAVNTIYKILSMVTW